MPELVTPPAIGADAEALSLDGLNLNDAGTWTLLELTNLPPRKKLSWVGSSLSDGSDQAGGETRYENREIIARLAMAPQADRDSAQAVLKGLTLKLQECIEDDPQALVWAPDNSSASLTYYVKAAEYDEIPITWADGYFSLAQELVVHFYCKPFGYGDWVTGTPAVLDGSFPLGGVEVADVAGDVEAEGQLIVTDGASVDRAHLEWGRQSRGYNASAPLMIDSSGFVVSGYAASSASRSGAFGGTVARATIGPTAVILGTTGAQLHVGDWKVRGRFYTALDDVLLRLAWRVGDGPWAPNPYATPGAGNFYDLDLGAISVPVADLGSQAWEGRIEAYSPTGGTLDCDYLEFIPLERYGRARAPLQPVVASTYAAADSFAGSAGSLTGQSLDTGGSWANVSGGSANDFSKGFGTAIRSATGDAVNAGRYLTAGATSYAAVSVQALVRSDSNGVELGLLARLSDVNNWLRLIWIPGLTNGELYLSKRVAGTVTTLFLGGRQFVGPALRGTLKLVVDTLGRWAIYFNGSLVHQGQDADLATGGALASGKIGIYDENAGGSSVRYVDNFVAFTSAQDVVTHSGKATEITSQGAERQAASGSAYGKVPEYRGSRFFLAPAGDDALKNLVVVKHRRNDVEAFPDDHIADPTTVQVNHRPRFLASP